MGLFGILPAKIWAGLGAAVALAAVLGGAYMVVDARAYARCEGDSALAVIHAQEAAHQEHLAAIERGDQIAAELIKTQRRLDAKHGEYLAYAHAITGNCPASLGLLTSAASGGQAGLPETTRDATHPPAADGSADIAARLIGANVAVNYARFKECIARYDALIDWHEKAVK